jgi:hypothetical protein
MKEAERSCIRPARSIRIENARQIEKLLSARGDMALSAVKLEFECFARTMKCARVTFGCGPKQTRATVSLLPNSKKKAEIT